jgi:hypothetical protein
LILFNFITERHKIVQTNIFDFIFLILKLWRNLSSKVLLWIQIQWHCGSGLTKFLNPDPDWINPDPQPCMKQNKKWYSMPHLKRECHENLIWFYLYHGIVNKIPTLSPYILFKTIVIFMSNSRNSAVSFFESPNTVN